MFAIQAIRASPLLPPENDSEEVHVEIFMYSLFIAIFYLKYSHVRVYVCVRVRTCVLKRHFGIDISRLTE